MPYPEQMVAPMRAELTTVGVQELRTPAEVDAWFAQTSGYGPAAGQLGLRLRRRQRAPGREAGPGPRAATRPRGHRVRRPGSRGHGARPRADRRRAAEQPVDRDAEGRRAGALRAAPPDRRPVGRGRGFRTDRGLRRALLSSGKDAPWERSTTTRVNCTASPSCARTGDTVYVGRCDMMDDRAPGAARRRHRTSRARTAVRTRQYLQRAARFGVWKKHDRLVATGGRSSDPSPRWVIWCAGRSRPNRWRRRIRRPEDRDAGSPPPTKPRPADEVVATDGRRRREVRRAAWPPDRVSGPRACAWACPAAAVRA